MREPLLLQLALRCFGAPDTWIGGGGGSNRLRVGIKKDSDGVESPYTKGFAEMIVLACISTYPEERPKTTRRVKIFQKDDNM